MTKNLKVSITYLNEFACKDFGFSAKSLAASTGRWFASLLSGESRMLRSFTKNRLRPREIYFLLINQVLPVMTI